MGCDREGRLSCTLSKGSTLSGCRAVQPTDDEWAGCGCTAHVLTNRVRIIRINSTTRPTLPNALSAISSRVRTPPTALSSR